MVRSVVLVELVITGSARTVTVYTLQSEFVKSCNVVWWNECEVNSMVDILAVLNSIIF